MRLRVAAYAIWALVAFLAAAMAWNNTRQNRTMLCLTIAGPLYIQQKELTGGGTYLFAETPDGRDIYINRGAVVECTKVPEKRTEPKVEPQSLREKT